MNVLLPNRSPHVDFMGTPIEVGDYVVVPTGRATLSLRKVEKLTPKSVKVVHTSEGSRVGPRYLPGANLVRVDSKVAMKFLLQGGR